MTDYKADSFGMLSGGKIASFTGTQTQEEAVKKVQHSSEEVAKAIEELIPAIERLQKGAKNGIEVPGGPFDGKGMIKSRLVQSEKSVSFHVNAEGIDVDAKSETEKRHSLAESFLPKLRECVEKLRGVGEMKLTSESNARTTGVIATQYLSEYAPALLRAAEVEGLGTKGKKNPAEVIAETLNSDRLGHIGDARQIGSPQVDRGKATSIA